VARHRARRERLPDRGGRGRGRRAPPRTQVVGARARAEAGCLRARGGLAGAGTGRHWH
jgi:hypothetical protein